MEKQIKLKITTVDELGVNEREIYKWIKDYEVKDINELKLNNQKKSDELGAISIIEMIIASKALIELIKCLKAWIISRRSKTSIMIEVDNTKFEINMENARKSDLEFVENILKVVKKDG